MRSTSWLRSRSETAPRSDRHIGPAGCCAIGRNPVFTGAGCMYAAHFAGLLCFRLLLRRAAGKHEKERDWNHDPNEPFHHANPQLRVFSIFRKWLYAKSSIQQRQASTTEIPSGCLFPELSDHSWIICGRARRGMRLAGAAAIFTVAVITQPYRSDKTGQPRRKIPR